MSERRVPHRFTVVQYDRMIDVGILRENDRVELIRGEIVAKMPIGDPHIACVDRLTRLFVRATRDDVVVSIQNPVRLADSEPEPDLVLKKANGGSNGKPSSSDVLLLIEVADDSLDYDREVKGPLYAENGIGEYWIVNLNDNRVEVYRQPKSDGTYADVQTLRAGDSIDVAALPGVTIAVGDILPR
jgi:Uma2 family endonuclease